MNLFISYSHDNEQHKEWVAKLASDLRSHGVDVILDRWDLRIGDDLPFFMENGLSKSNLVLVICSSLYVEKANAGRYGAGYEKRILSSDMLSCEKQNFIIPIIRNNPQKLVPQFLKGLLYIDFTSDEDYITQYRQLLARIYDEDIKEKPALGTNPFDKKALSYSISKKLELDKIKYTKNTFEGKVHFDYSSNNGIFTIGVGEYTFNTMWTRAGSASIHCYKDHVKRLGYNANFDKYPSFTDLIQFDYSSRSRTVQIGEVFVLENNYNNFAAIKVLGVHNSETDQNNYVDFEYKIFHG